MQDDHIKESLDVTLAMGDAHINYTQQKDYV
jgi:hypothetical protein